MNISRILRRTHACILLGLSSLPLVSHAAEITGRVTAADGITPLPGITVQARFEEFSWYGAVTNSNGEYSFTGLPAATYKIRFEDNALNTYRSEWHNDASDYASASSFVLGETDVQSGVDASLAEGGRLIGTVTADSGGAALAGIQVSAYRFASTPSFSYWETVKTVTSQANGSYDIGGLDDGAYRLGFLDPAGNYAREYHDNKTDVNIADSVSIASSASVTTHASLAAASRIQGVVTDELGNPLQGIYLYSYRSNGGGSWSYMGQATTLADGSYDLGGLGAGSYRIEFSDSAGYHVREYYDDAADFGSATDVTVGASMTLTGYDATLAPAGRIEGRVTDGSGTGIPNINLAVYRWNTSGSYWESFEYGYSDGNGYYTAGGLPTGTYRVEAYDNSGTYPVRYYANAADLESADDVEVTAGSATTGIDIALEALVVGSIAGTVSDTGASGLANIDVTLFRYNQVGEYWEEINYTTTDASGFYSFGTIEVGTYRLRFIDSTETFASEYYTDAYTVESGDDVVVTSGSETIADAVLSEAASISGMVTYSGAAPLQGIWVNLSRLDSSFQRQYLFSRISQAGGTYSFGGLPEGTYFVEFADYSPSVTYAREFYNNQPTYDGAEAIVLAVGEDLIGIDADMELTGQIAGTVTADAGGGALQFISVTAYRLNEVTGNWDYASNVSTNASGAYNLQGLVSGQYRLEFRDASGNYIGEFYNNQATLALGDNVAVLAGAQTPGINASLATASRIAGTVTAEGSGTALPNVQVTAYRVTAPNSFEYVFSDTTDQNGDYSVGGLTAGTYRISFNDNNGYYQSEVFDNATGSLDTGTDVLVNAAATTPGINAQLVAGGKISGTVTDALTSSALGGIGIYFYRYDGVSWQYQNSAWTDPTGAYASTALPVGQYRVEFYDFNSNYRTQYYNNRFEFDDSTQVTVNPLQTTASIDAALDQPPITISGTITDAATSFPLEGIFALAYRFSSTTGKYEYQGEASTDYLGAYTIENLQPGLYRLRFSDRTSGYYAQQFYNAANSLTSANPILVETAGADYVGLDAAMQPALTINGRLSDESGNGIEGALAYVQRWEPVNNEWFFVNAASTDEFGYYTIAGLAEGTYRMGFVAAGYISEFYDGNDGVPAVDAASDLELDASFGDLYNIDAILSTSASEPVKPVMTGFRQIGPGTFEADFQGQPGTMYQLERSPTMLPMSWLPDGSPFEAESGGNLLNMSSTEPKMFWRVREQ
jgi:protocatechuate 3,4-dioxygenase beta subunit